MPRARRRGLAVVAVVARRQADGALRGPRVLPAVGEGLRRSARRCSRGSRCRGRGARGARGTAATSPRRLVSLHVKRPRETRRSPPIPRSSAKAARAGGARRPRIRATPCPERREARAVGRRGPMRSRAQMHGVDRRIQIRTETLARQFDRVLGRPGGARLRGRVGDHAEGADARADLRRGRPAGGGGARRRRCSTSSRRPRSRRCVSAVVYESRERVPAAGRAAHRAHRGAVRAAGAHVPPDPARRRRSTRCELSRALDAGFATPVFHWAEGKPLEDVLEETEMAPGRLRPQLQAADRPAAPDRGRRASGETAAQFRHARGSVMHGVVAYTGV